MIRIDATYSDYFKPADEEYPWGSAIDASTAESSDGTPYKARWRNDVIGAMQAVFYRAFNGTSRKPSNNPDTVLASDFADAIEQIITNISNTQMYQVSAQGEETIIEWSTFGRAYNPDANFLIIALAAGNYEEFLPVGAEAKSDGIHLYPRRIIDGKIVAGTRCIKWGSFVFGERKFGESETMNINLIIKELKQ